MHKQKIFCIGAHKTGTQSIGEALRICGYKVCNGLHVKTDFYNAFLKRCKQIIESNRYDAFRDDPWNHLYQEINKNFPGNKFILTVRDSNDWLKSATAHFDTRTADYLKWLYKDVPITQYPDEWVKHYENHNQNVMDYFSSFDNLLVIDICNKEGWEKLLPFLGIKMNSPVTKRPFPFKNKTIGRKINRSKK